MLKLNGSEAEKEHQWRFSGEVPQIIMSGSVYFSVDYVFEIFCIIILSSLYPKVVKDVAQNILSFMKANCTREGHTYWLFKGIVVFNFASVNPLHHITHFGENGQVLLLAYLFLNKRRLRCNEIRGSRSSWSFFSQCSHFPCGSTSEVTPSWNKLSKVCS